MEYVILATIAVFGTINAVLIWLFSRSLGQITINGINQLDHSMAEAIKKVLEGNFDMPEPPNPLMMYILESLKSNNVVNSPPYELTRDDQGKFA